MKIKYAFATETVEIEVPEEWGNILVDLDRQEYNIDHKETRRHCSLEAYNLDDALLPSDVDVLRDLINGEETRSLHNAIDKLEPSQQELIRAIYFEGVSISAYADRCGVSQPAMSQRKATAIKNLKKFLL